MKPRHVTVLLMIALGAVLALLVADAQAPTKVARIGWMSRGNPTASETIASLPGFIMAFEEHVIVEFGSQHSNKEGKAMRGPGAYRPDPTEGMTAMADLPPPEVVPSSRNDKRQPCPRCGDSAYRDTQSQRTLHD